MLNFYKKSINKELWPDGKRPITFNEDGTKTIWWWLIALPCVLAFCGLHFAICIILQVFVRSEQRRLEWYEYYRPYGWRPLEDKGESCPVK